ncbi:MAG: CCA tRNA nucleotidyltransferase [Methanomethylovorans sp.]|jgi:tRNA nucleotidyltransferase (CCA-adding enzyme)|nr:CCA tRNA nucleotidyltransferase [Methanomethylovorans sp.]
METNELKELKNDVLKKISPTHEERAYLEETAELLRKKIEHIAHGMNLKDVSVTLVGSAARNTWISGTHDLDLFIMFPSETSNEELEKNGMEIARKIAKEAESFEERYAEHPYINMIYRGFDVDIVPCFRVKSASCIRSAVDRTPFHNEFVKKNIYGLESEVLLLKQFMKGIGVYGSELRTQGFSGYLTELLIIKYGSFEEVINSACEWQPGTYIDLKSHGTIQHTDPLVVIDPTDPKRNVAAALSLDKFCFFIDACRQFRVCPTMDFFFPKPVTLMSDTELLQKMKSRGTAFIAILFNTPDVVEDVLYPQLHKMEQAVVSLLETHEFKVLNKGSWSGEKTIILLELMSATLPQLRKHRGPPVWIYKHADSFKAKYGTSKDVFAFYIENGTYIAEVPRKYSEASSLLKEKLNSCSMGKHVSCAVKKGFEVLKDGEICSISERDFKLFLMNWPKV